VEAHLLPLLALVPSLPRRPVSPVPATDLSADDLIAASHSLQSRNAERCPLPQRLRSSSDVGLPQWTLEVPLECTAADTLFFAFYHQAGSWAQLRAAQELQRQGWLYHRKYQTWFRASASGSYDYFDHEGAWALRTKPGFVFDPSMQEDAD